MALSNSEIFDNPELYRVIKVQSANLYAMRGTDPRLAAAFATQQRWLMSHVGAALHYRGLVNGGKTGLHIKTFLDAVSAARIASRNTADAFIKEMIKYKYIEVLPSSGDRRIRPLGPMPHTLAAIDGWLRIHLHSLDSLAGGGRLSAYEAMPGAIARMQPLIADQLVIVHGVRHPERTFSLFTWLDNGGWIMDWMMSNMEDAPLSAERTTVGMVSTVELAERMLLSRTHLARKLRDAEAMGSLGWEGRRGNSAMWVSRGFREEYAAAQAVKLSIIDQAAEAILGPAVVERTLANA
jgi:hypothetical protein